MRLDFTGISKSFNGQQALKEFTVSVPEFKCLAIVGPSGGGKTTLLRIMAGLTAPESGEFAINGVTLRFDEQSLRAHRRSVGTVFQAYNLFPHLTALENIILPLEKVHGFAVQEARDSAMQLLKRFHLADQAAKRPAELSGGQQQRVAIVRAIAIKPRFLLFDEPTSALDPEMTAEVLDLITELRSEGRELIIVTHNMGFARHVADRCLFIASGRAVVNGTVDDFFTDPGSEIQRAFLAKVLRY